MSEAIIVALITAAAAVVGQWLIGQRNTADLYAKLDKQSEISDQKIHGEIDVIKTEIVQLKDEVKKHNGVVERTYKLEQQSAIHTEQIKVANHRIDDLERGSNG